MPAYTHTHLFLLRAKYTHKEHKQYKLMQVYTNELMHHFQKDGHVSCTYAHWQNLTNVKGKNNTDLPPSLPPLSPPLLPPTLGQVLIHLSPPLSPDNSCTTPAAHHSLPNAVGCVNTTHSHIHRRRTVGLVWVSRPDLAIRGLHFF